MMNKTPSTSGNWTETSESSKSQSLCFVDDLTSIKTAKIFFYSVIFVASLIGNSLMLNTVLKDVTLRKSINQFIGNISLANLVITIVYMPRMMVMVVDGSLWMIKGVIGLVLCKVVPVLHHACILVSILSLTALSIDRFFYIVIPTKQIFNKKKQKFVIPLMWLVGILVRFPSLYALTLKAKNETTDVTCGGSLDKAFKSQLARKTYYTFLLIFFYALPLILIVIFYSIIIVFLKNRKTVSTRRYEVERTAETKYREASKKTLKMLIIVTVSFVVCWATYFSAQIAFKSVPCELRFWRFFLAHCNSAISPYLCMMYNTRYRQHVRNTLYRKCCVCCAVCEVVEEYEME